MKLVVVSSPKDHPNEIVEVIRMFEAGLEHFHIRKPRYEPQGLDEYIKLFPEKYRSRLIIHSYHGLGLRTKFRRNSPQPKTPKERKVLSLQTFRKKEV